jgi:hypothetical protein
MKLKKNKIKKTSKANMNNHKKIKVKIDKNKN